MPSSLSGAEGWAPRRRPGLQAPRSPAAWPSGGPAASAASGSRVCGRTPWRCGPSGQGAVGGPGELEAPGPPPRGPLCRVRDAQDGAPVGRATVSAATRPAEGGLCLGDPGSFARTHLTTPAVQALTCGPHTPRRVGIGGRNEARADVPLVGQVGAAAVVRSPASGAPLLRAVPLSFSLYDLPALRRLSRLFLPSPQAVLRVQPGIYMPPAQGRS